MVNLAEIICLLSLFEDFIDFSLLLLLDFAGEAMPTFKLTGTFCFFGLLSLLVENNSFLLLLFFDIGIAFLMSLKDLGLMSSGDLLNIEAGFFSTGDWFFLSVGDLLFLSVSLMFLTSGSKKSSLKNNAKDTCHQTLHTWTRT